MKTKIISLVILLSFTFSSCESWLDEKNYIKFTEDNTFKSKEDALASLYGIYAILQTNNMYGGAVVRSIAENASDILKPLNATNLWNAYSFAPTTNHFSNWWRGNYGMITAANNFISAIELVPNYEIGMEEKRALKAEAKFLRALAYYNLIIAYGRVPLILNCPKDESEVSYPFRASLKDLYSLIISDLREAERMLPVYNGSVQEGRALRGSAAGLLAKVYLTKGYNQEVAESTDFENAVDLCEEIIDGHFGPYALIENFGDIFSPDNEGNPELMFVVKFDLLPNKSSRIVLNYSPTSYYPAQTTGVANASFSFVASFDQQNDKRFKYGIMTTHPETGVILDPRNKRPYFCKFKDKQKTISGDDRCDFPILRFADILLMHSEALYAGNIATSKKGRDKFYGINEIRRRAREKVITGVCRIEDLNEGNMPMGMTFIDVILQERAWELNCEGHRRWDLIRTGKFESVMTQYYQAEEAYPPAPNSFAKCAVLPHHILYPMPQTEVDLNPNLVPAGETNNGYKSFVGGDDEINE